MKTFMAKAGEVEKKWYVVDVQGKVLGRAASEVAKILRGKHKPQYTPHVDTGDYVIVINADKVVLTGKKLDQKVYRRHTGWIGNLKEIKYSRFLETRPERVLNWQSRECFPATAWGGKCSRNSRFMPETSTTTRLRNPKCLSSTYNG